MERKTRICSTCGREYQYCPKCDKDADKPQWLFAWCSENCKNIYEITSQYEDGRIDVLKVKEELDRLDLSRFEYFGKSYKNTIDKINKEIEKTQSVNNVQLESYVYDTEDKKETLLADLSDIELEKIKPSRSNYYRKSGKDKK